MALQENFSSMDKLHGLGWKHQIELEEGIKSVYNEALNKQLLS